MQRRYILMHGEAPVCECAFDDGYFVGIRDMLHAEHAPVGTRVEPDRIATGLLGDWFLRRGIPDRRVNVSAVRSAVRGVPTSAVMESSLAMNLSDSYWLRPVGSDLKWEDVNLFDNGFDDAFGMVTLGASDGIMTGNIPMSPDGGTSGNLSKKWVAASDGTRVLVKGASGSHRQQPANEVAASLLCDALGIEHVPYGLVRTSVGVCSACPCAVSAGEDFVAAYDIAVDGGRMSRGYDDDVRFYREFGENIGVDVVSEFGKMVLVDCTIRNEDRHWCNFGLVRDAVTLEYTRVFPLFDFGNSLWFSDDEPLPRMEATSRMSHRPLSDDLRWVPYGLDVDVGGLYAFSGIVRDVFGAAGIDAARTDAIAEMAHERAVHVAGLVPGSASACHGGKERVWQFGSM